MMTEPTPASPPAPAAEPPQPDSPAAEAAPTMPPHAPAGDGPAPAAQMAQADEAAPPAKARSTPDSPPPPAQPPSGAPAATASLPGPLMLHMPVDVRNLSLALLALFASVALLHWASAVFIPIMLSLLLTTALRPVVEVLRRCYVPRWLGAGVLLIAIVLGLASAAWSLSDGAAQLVDSLPVAAKKVRDSLKARTGASSPLDTMQKAATQIEQAANENSATASPPRRGVQRVVVERPPFNIRDYLWSGTMGLMSALGQLTVVVFLTYFALASGNLFRNKLLRIAGTSLERRKVTIHVLEDITNQIQRYLMVQVFTSVLVGVATGLAYWALGLENAAVWGVAAGVLNLAPYIGSALVTGASALVAFLQFGTLDMALAIGGASLVIHTLVGNLLTPWLTSRTSSMSPVAVFVSVLAWGWLWGLWGLLLGIPVMMAVKAVCDRVEDLKAVGELLGD
ncbi:MAG: AI-2E family transporter [Burkholderiales bacterium RIFCSPHIGHO2_12_FULL_65_48]|nr:MAG: AI-2E family transporter [Burkholderiales bacterium RIFCSPHIGHO2_12_FULL_65_48]OGB58551.1 MAG: AI-2E family transporter [Burkholderiales bacterium RIFCSPLOWO2_12_FULL_64_33]